MSRDAAGRVLVVGPAWAGDMVMANALLQLLHRRGRTVDVLAPTWSLPLLARMAEVDTALTMPAGHGELALRTRVNLGRSLRGKYAQSIVLPNSFKSALVPFFARIPRRTGYLGEHRYGVLNDIRPPHPGSGDQTAARYAALAADGDSPVQTPRPRLSASGDNAESLARTHALFFNRPTVALCVGAEYGAARRWPAEHFAALADLAAADGYQVWLLGSPRDAAVAAAVTDAVTAAAPVNLCGKTSLPDAVDLLARASVVVSNDSGLLHIAAAVGRPVVALYGSTPPAIAPPLCEVNSVLYLALECSPCFRRVCPLGHFNCMRDLHPQRVMSEVRALTDSGAS